MMVVHDTIRGFDHCPLIVNMEQVMARGQQMFHFEAFWAKEEGCKEVVQKSWSNQIDGDWLNTWLRKLKIGRSNLKKWNKE